MIRKAHIDDCEQIYNLINTSANEGKLLKRSLNHIYEHLRDFWVYVERGKVIACCGLGIVGWQGLGEIKSLAVKKKFQKKGIGLQLVKKCIEEASVLKLSGVFALTFVPGFFRKLKFKAINRDKLPHKIWSDCVHCIYFPDCREEAVFLKLSASKDT
ncbi:MAG: N-acetyltransferase [Candidatus Omnitrophica bacterium]|nr:N-acetyltransferase [Candidatus Omnitrophota bacterium]MDD5429125.1 N-acetyltransferase [Candidatus Omnitrophota bacterium]